MKIPIVIDRIGDGLATLAMTIPAEILPENAREGDALYYDDEGRLQIDVERTRTLRKNTLELFDGLIDKE